MQNGKHAVLSGLIDGFGFGSTEFHVIRPGEEITSQWIHLFLRRKETLNAAINTLTGAVGQQRVPESFLEELEIPLPDTDVQKQIAATAQAQLAEVETARQAAVLQLQDARILRTRVLAGIFKQLASVETKTLGDFASTTSGSTPSRGIKQYWEPAEIPWVKTGEVNFSTITATEEAISKTALAECSLTLLPPQSVLVAMIGQGKTRGQSAFLAIEATTNQNCFAVLPNDTWEPEFLYYWFVSSYQFLRNFSADRGGNQSALNGALLRALRVPAPDKTQQRHVIQQVKAALSEVAALEESSKTTLADIEQLPNRILAHAFES
jgi:type I restriction enzyme S subunit